MDIFEQYSKKLLTSDEAVRQIDGMHNLILAMGVAMPPGLITALAEALKADDVKPLSVYYMHGSEVLKNTLLSEDLIGKVQARPLFLSAYDRMSLKERGQSSWMEFVPCTFHQVGRLLTQNIEPDCFMATVSGMDRHGYFSLGTNADYGASVIRKAKKVIVEVNENMPRTFGECSVHISEIDCLIENNQPLHEIMPGAADETDQCIAKNVAELINDGDTLQMGVGGVPSAVLAFLDNHKNLGLHSELFSPPMADLIEKGVINGRHKRWMQHKHVYTLALGDRKMYEFMDDNPSIVGYPASWVNNPTIIAKNRNMVSVNSAIEIDLTGQINAEQINGNPFSGTGGQLDFVRGAYASEGGRSFITLRSTAMGGGVSRIVPTLNGGAVTDTRMDTNFVVTEYGCVDLKGLSLTQRAKALISLAHPDYRELLEKQAKTLSLI